MATLRIYLHNAENLFIFPPPLDAIPANWNDQDWQINSTRMRGHKNLSDLVALAHTLEAARPDVACLVEVGGLESLENFNRLFLEDKFEVKLLPSNSDRGIDLGFLVKKGLISKITSYRHRVIGPRGERFSRDCPRLDLFDEKGKLSASIFLVHLKSKLNMKGNDHLGLRQRELEVNALLKFMSEHRRKHKKLPIAVCGDFNGQVEGPEKGEEFQALRNSDLTRGPYPEQGFLTTYSYFNQHGQKIDQQLDYAFGLAPTEIIGPERLELLDSMGQELPPPRTLEQKKNLPSDHYPIAFTLQLI